MTFEAAYRKVALAGRELGSGPARAAERMGAETLTGLKSFGIKEEFALSLNLGVVIGRVMADDPEMLALLDEIHIEWRDGQHR